MTRSRPGNGADWGRTLPTLASAGLGDPVAGVATGQLEPPPSPFRRRLHRARRAVLDPQLALVVVLLALLAYVIVVPLASIAWTTLSWSTGDLRFSPNAIPGAFTLEHWQRVVAGPVSDALLWQPLLNTLLVGSIAALGAVALGAGIAWLVTRTDLPGRDRYRTLLVFPYMLPSLALALAWITIFRSGSIGGRPGVWENLFGVAPPDWLALGPVPITVIVTVHYFPFAFLLVAAALVAVDAQLEESAELQGASRATILRRITFPLVAPALLSAFVLTFGKTIGTFAAIQLLGVPAGFDTMSTMIFGSIGLGLSSNAFVLSIVLIVLAAAVVYLNSRVLGTTARYVTISGKGFKSNPVNLRAWRWPLAILLAAFVGFFVAVPIGLLLYQSVSLVPGVVSLENLTGYFWVGESDSSIFPTGEPGVLANDGILSGAWNSLRLALGGAVLGALLGALIGYVTVRTRWPVLTRILDQIAFIPYLIPGIAFGAVYLSLFAVQRGPVPALFGTFALLLLVVTVNSLPFTTRTGSSAVTQIGRELEEAAEVQGAGWLRRFRRIVLPLASSGIVAGMMISFIGIMRELSLIVILITPSTAVLMSQTLRYAAEGFVQHGNALILIIIGITFIGELVLWRLGRSKLSRLSGA
ncbi:MAG: ABC transporter permease [Candidatus Limnocylindria bacterium]